MQALGLLIAYLRRAHHRYRLGRFNDRRIGLGRGGAARGRHAKHRTVRAFGIAAYRNGFQQRHVLASLAQHETAVGQALGHQTGTGQQRGQARLGRVTAPHARTLAAAAQVAMAADEQAGLGRISIQHLAQWPGGDVELAVPGLGGLRVDDADGRPNAQRQADGER
ncbi:hypothetical protein D3C71_1332510 [compost metagenome]